MTEEEKTMSTDCVMTWRDIGPCGVPYARNKGCTRRREREENEKGIESNQTSQIRRSRYSDDRLRMCPSVARQR